ncbi:MAG: glycosyl transferase family 2 [Bacteroidales bacterium]|nr:glycosyl transferase family 2 [Bacteroidales bacterium]
MQATFIIQARLGSSRLPGKILLPFYENKTILDLLIEKLKKVSPNIILATSHSEENALLKDVALANNINFFQGSENDVLQRFIDAAEKYNTQKIIRVCSDNPFLDLDALIQIVQESQSFTGDYMSFMIDGTPSIKTHFGFWTEYVTLDALKRVVQSTDSSLYHEHVTNFIYSNPNQFRIKWLPVPTCLHGRQDIRLTIDTKEDFELLQTLYMSLAAQHVFPKLKDVLVYLEAHPAYYKVMKQQIYKNSK